MVGYFWIVDTLLKGIDLEALLSPSRYSKVANEEYEEEEDEGHQPEECGVRGSQETPDGTRYAYLEPEASHGQSAL